MYSKRLINERLTKDEKEDITHMEVMTEKANTHFSKRAVKFSFIPSVTFIRGKGV